MDRKSNRNNRNLDNRRDSENSRVEMSEELNINIDDEQQRKNKNFDQNQNRRARERANKSDNKSNKR